SSTAASCARCGAVSRPPPSGRCSSTSSTCAAWCASSTPGAKLGASGLQSRGSPSNAFGGGGERRLLVVRELPLMDLLHAVATDGHGHAHAHALDAVLAVEHDRRWKVLSPAVRYCPHHARGAEAGCPCGGAAGVERLVLGEPAAGEV